MSKLTPEQSKTAAKVAAALRFQADRKKFNNIDFYVPYPKQQAFHDLSLRKRERLLMAANQVGKTFCGAAEMSYHLTGRYPEWWLGRKFDRPIKAWAASKTGLSTRDTVQKYLCGEPGVVEAKGTGTIPKECILDMSNARGVDALCDTVQVRHVSGGVSILRFKTYDQGREKWQGETLDLIWFDEEPPEDIYGEGITRITATKGMVYVTFTPLKGRSTVVMRYTNEASPDRVVVGMTIDDAQHIPEEERAKIVAGYAAHEREARARGIPTLGSGRIFTYTEESLKWEPISPWPSHWTYNWGIDFGLGEEAHPFAAVLMGWDRDADILTIVHAAKFVSGGPLTHAEAMRQFGAIPVAWPQDGTARESNGETLAAQYKRHGLSMLDTHARWEDGGYSTEAGIVEMDERMATGRWKVAAHLEPWFEEYRYYHRDEGKIVKIRDDLLSASRIAMMMRTYGKLLPTVDWRKRVGARPVQRMALGIDFDVLG
jgi:phage terminase large subunit-like protein